MATPRRLVAVFALLALLAAAWNAGAGEKRPLKADDLAKLIELRIGDDAIIAKIQTDGIDFSLDARIKQRLKDAGASEGLLAALGVSAGASSTATIPPGEDAAAPPIMVWSQREYGHLENPLHSEFSINGKLIDIFTSDTRKDVGKYLDKGWNTVTLKTAPQDSATDANELIFSMGPVHKDAKSDKLVMQPVLWQFRNGTDWKFRDGQYSHRLGPDVKEIVLSYRVYFAGSDAERTTPENGDYVIQGRPNYGHLNSPLTLTVFINGTPLNSFWGEDRQVVITSFLKQGKNEFKLVSSRVKDAMADNDMDIEVIGPLKYNSREEKFEGKPILQSKGMQGWQREKESGQLVSHADSKAESVERTVAFMLEESPMVAKKATTGTERQ